jgi:hypothetical protein
MNTGALVTHILAAKGLDGGDRVLAKSLRAGLSMRSGCSRAREDSDRREKIATRSFGVWSLAINREIGDGPKPEIVSNRPSVTFRFRPKFSPHRECRKSHIEGRGDEAASRKPNL